MIKCTDEKKQIYFVQVKYRDPVSGKQRSKRKCGVQGKRNALNTERKMIQDLGDLTTTTTFRQMWTLWDKHTEATGDTLRLHKEHFEKRYADYVDMPMSKVSKAQLVNWRAQLSMDDRISTATKNMTIQYVCSVYRFAHEVYDFKNTALVLKPLKQTNEEIMAEMQVWTPEEYAKFSEKVDNPLYKLYFDTLYWTGMRRGEAIALQKSDLNGKWLFVHASQRTAKEGLKPTKTKQIRHIMIDDVLAEDLKPLLKEPGPYLFGGETILAPTTIDRKFREAIQKSGVKRIRIHDLRHSHATWLINNGANIVAVSKRLGHASIEQTLKTYTHLLRNTDEKLMEKINNFKKESPIG